MIKSLAVHSSSDAQQNGDVRLSGIEGVINRGVLEVYLKDGWGTVCYGTPQQKGLAQVACRQLGFNDYVNVTTASEAG